MSDGWRISFGMAEAFLPVGSQGTSTDVPLYVAGLIGPGDTRAWGRWPTAGPDDYDQLHHFVSSGVWDPSAREELAIQANLVGGPDAVLVITTRLPKKGHRGVARIRLGARQERLPNPRLLTLARTRCRLPLASGSSAGDLDQRSRTAAARRRSGRMPNATIQARDRFGRD